MGAAGAGKTTIGVALAQELGWRFVDADDLHPPENVAKMRAGIGLERADRLPWLRAVRACMEEAERNEQSLTVACSALTHEYRAILGDGLAVHFVYLRGDSKLLEQRLRQRAGHFAGPALLATQLAVLEDPGPAVLTLDAAATPHDIVAAIRMALKL